MLMNEGFQSYMATSLFVIYAKKGFNLFFVLSTYRPICYNRLIMFHYDFVIIDKHVQTKIRSKYICKTLYSI